MNSRPAPGWPTSASSPAPRYGGLDWLRAGASLAVVVLHAGIPYMSSPMPGLVWCTTDLPAQSVLVDGLCWGIDTFVMPLFFLIGGFLAAQSCERVGPVALVRNRTLRLGIPFLVGAVLILPLDLYVWLLGWVCEGRIIPRKLQSLKIDAPLSDQLLGPSHLWFLIYQWIFCAYGGLLAFWKTRPAAAEPATIPIRRGPSAWTRAAIVAGLFAISVAGLTWDPRVVIGFEQSILLTPGRLAYYAPCFVLGWLGRMSGIAGSSTLGLRLVAAAGLLFLPVWSIVAMHVAEPFSGWSRLGLTTGFAGCGWLAASGLFLTAIDGSRTVTPLVGYLSRASLWIYLAHHPVVGLTQVSLRVFDLPGPVKCGLAAAVGIAMSLLTYEAFVRGKRLDEWLNGTVRPAALDEKVIRKAA